jgi:phytoene dehydrogenase-like protein
MDAGSSAIKGLYLCKAAIHKLFQNLLWRPFPEAANHRNVVKGLWHIGASTHPGSGLSGGSGHLAAQKLLSK